MEIPFKFLAIIIFIMAFTYSATAIIYDDYQYVESIGGLSPEATDTTIGLESLDEQFQDTFRLAWIDAYTLITQNGDPAWQFSTHDETLITVQVGYYVLKYIIHPIGEMPERGWGTNIIYYTDYTYISHIDAWNNYMTSDERVDIAWDYNVKYGGVDISWGEEDYDYDTEDTKELGFLDAIFDTFGKIGDGIVSLFKIFTFRIPNMPSSLSFILSIIFLPLWIILMIGILPLLTKIIEAFAHVLNAIIPF